MYVPKFKKILTMTSKNFEIDEQVTIVAGLYMRHHFGTYLWPYGMKIATVLIVGKERNICLTSIQKIESTEGNETITISRIEYES
jgi:predicted GTPase